MSKTFLRVETIEDLLVMVRQIPTSRYITTVYAIKEGGFEIAVRDRFYEEDIWDEEDAWDDDEGEKVEQSQKVDVDEEMFEEIDLDDVENLEKYIDELKESIESSKKDKEKESDFMRRYNEQIKKADSFMNLYMYIMGKPTDKEGE